MPEWGKNEERHRRGCFAARCCLQNAVIRHTAQRPAEVQDDGQPCGDPFASRVRRHIACRYVQDKPGAVAPVTASNDIAAWTKEGFETTLTKAGAPVGTKGSVLHVRIEMITTNENVLHRAGYDGRIALSLELVPAGGGPACWSDHVEGSSENYGYAGSIENYQETLNHALDRAAMRAFSSPAFRKAVCSCGGN
jgi:hypothetical protein